MAIYHTRIKTFSRSKQHSAVAAAAYRGALCLTDARTGKVHDYRTRSGVQRVACISPIGAPAWLEDPEQLWNEAEAAERRKDSTVCRDFEIALPHELDDEGRWALANDIARTLVLRFQFAIQVSMHAPPKDADPRHFYAHLLATTRKINEKGFGLKTRELDGVINGKSQIDWIRTMIADSIKSRLQRFAPTELLAEQESVGKMEPLMPAPLPLSIATNFEGALLSYRNRFEEAAQSSEGSRAQR